MKNNRTRASKVLIPPDIIKIDGPLIFLAGPIQSAENWQEKAIGIIHRIAPGIVIASPRRDYLAGDFIYEKQVDWETHYLNEAGERGVIMFWLAKEFKHDCTRAYGQTSRFELGEWKARHELAGAKLVVGIEDGFSNGRYIRRRMSQDCPGAPVCDSLNVACEAAVELLRENT